MTTPTITPFARRLRSLRTAAGLSQGQLAAAAGLARQYVYQLEAGRRAPGWETVRALARALAVSTEAFDRE